MRFIPLMSLSLLAGLTTTAVVVPAQVNVGIRLSARLGPEVGVYAYNQERYGDWRRATNRWTPVTLYAYNNHFYRHTVRGARPVSVYAYRDEFFLPPRDAGWVGYDRRYDYRSRPRPSDEYYARPWDRGGVSIDVRLGPELSLFYYEPNRLGDWQRSYQQWTPMTVYERSGRYYANNGPGTRPVMIYHYRNEYFLPPDDQRWMGYDRRYDYRMAPNRSDRGRGHGYGNGNGNGRGRGRGSF